MKPSRKKKNFSEEKRIKVIYKKFCPKSSVFVIFETTKMRSLSGIGYGQSLTLTP